MLAFHLYTKTDISVQVYGWRDLPIPGLFQRLLRFKGDFESSNNLVNIKIMAKDSAGKKFNRIPEHKRRVGGKTITVKEHIRSNRKDSKGKK